jgi:hypothetical protein
MNAWLILGGLLIGSVAGGLFEHNRLMSGFNEERLELQKKIDFQKEAIAAMSDQVILGYTNQQTQVETRYRTIYKEAQNVVASNPANASCVLSDDWVRVYNSALKGSGSNSAAPETK